MPLRENRSLAARSFLFGIIGLLAAVLLVAAALITYAAPEEELDWSSAPLPNLEEKARAIVAERKLTVRLTESEIDALIKQRLRQQAAFHEYAEVTGARFELEGDRLVADTIVRIADTADAAVTHRFLLEWQAPDIVITHLSSNVKHFELPKQWVPFQQVKIPLPLDKRLPFAIKSVEFTDESVDIHMRWKLPDL